MYTGASRSSKYDDFVFHARRLVSKLLIQGFVIQHLKSSMRKLKFFGRYIDLNKAFRMINDSLDCDQVAILHVANVTSSSSQRHVYIYMYIEAIA